MTVLDEKSEDQSYQISSSVALVTLCQCEHGSNKQLTSKDRAEKNTGKKEKNTNMPCRRTCRSHSELLVKQRPQNSQGRRFSALGPELLVLLVGDARTSGKKSVIVVLIAMEWKLIYLLRTRFSPAVQRLYWLLPPIQFYCYQL